ncbi:MAG: hypothetical protein V2J24_23815 [Pseudomonadales bacterium]|jgi:hypothetical protein|nr:hypothetical protein [Pseudomonadales bacterium]
MSVLEPSDESRMLREAAKGWSAGSVPLEDYRMIRRATLASMLGVDPDEEDIGAGLLAADAAEDVEHRAPSARSAGEGRMIIVIAAAAIVVVGSALALFLAD